MENPANHSEGDTLKQLSAETVRQKHHLKYLPRLQFLRSFFREKENFLIVAEISKLQKERDLLRVQIREDDVEELDLQIVEVETKRLEGRGLWETEEDGKPTEKTREALRDKIYTDMVMKMQDLDERSGGTRLVGRIVPHIFRRVDQETKYFEIYHQLGIFPLVMEGVKGQLTRVDGLEIHWGQKMPTGGRFTFEDSLAAILNQLVIVRAGFYERIRQFFLAKFFPKRRIDFPDENPEQKFKTAVLLEMVQANFRGSVPSRLVHETLHGAHNPKDVFDYSSMMLSLWQKYLGRELSIQEIVDFQRMLNNQSQELAPIYAMLIMQRPALAEAHAYSRHVPRGGLVPTQEERVKTVTEARNASVQENLRIEILQEQIRSAEKQDELLILEGIPGVDEIKFVRISGQVKIDYIKRLQGQLEKLLTAAPKLYPRIDISQLKYAFSAVDKLDALGFSPQAVGKVIKTCGWWNEKTQTFPDMEAAIRERQTALNLTEDDVENLVLARRLEREIDALRALQIARGEVKKFYSEYYAQK